MLDRSRTDRDMYTLASSYVTGQVSCSHVRPSLFIVLHTHRVAKHMTTLIGRENILNKEYYIDNILFLCILVYISFTVIIHIKY